MLLGRCVISVILAEKKDHLGSFPGWVSVLSDFLARAPANSSKWSVDRRVAMSGLFMILHCQLKVMPTPS